MVTEGVVKEERPHPLAGKTLSGDDQIFELRRSFYGALPGREKDDPTPVSACVALYKRDLLNNNAIRFRKIRSEDKFFNIEACRCASRIRIIADVFYNYRKDGQPSITRSFTQDTISSFEKMLSDLWLLACSESGARQNECQMRVSRHVLDSLRGLVLLLEASNASNTKKLCYTDKICEMSLLQHAKRIPWWTCPLVQASFSFCMLHKHRRLLLVLAHLRNTQGIIR